MGIFEGDEPALDASSSGKLTEALGKLLTADER
jgi:hypothetical protein